MSECDLNLDPRSIDHNELNGECLTSSDLVTVAGPWRILTAFLTQPIAKAYGMLLKLATPDEIKQTLDQK